MLLTSFVRTSTSSSRAPHTDLSSRDAGVGMCTDGRSMRHDTSLNVRASRWSVLIPRAPTPSDFTSDDATTRTSWPQAFAAYFTHRDHRNRRIVITETADGDRVRDGDGDWLDLFLGGLLGAAPGGSL